MKQGYLKISMKCITITSHTHTHTHKYVCTHVATCTILGIVGTVLPYIAIWPLPSLILVHDILDAYLLEIELVAYYLVAIVHYHIKENISKKTQLDITTH